MPRSGPRRHSAAVALCIALSALVVTACGDDDEEESSKPTTLAITTTELGKKKFKTEAPASIEGGLVEIRFRNAGKALHNAEVLRLDGGHKVEEAFKLFDSRKPVIPDWLHFEGGVSATAPGKTSTAKLRLPPGDYAVIDTESSGGDGPPPALFGAKATFKVTGDNGGKLEETASKLAVKDKGHHEYEFAPSNLKVGENEVTFDNRSKQLHHLVAFPIVGKATLADVKKALAEEGKTSGPPPVDFEKGTGVSPIDGKKKLTTRISLSKGRNVLICFLTDRDGKGKSHVEEGMVKEVTVQ